MYRRNSLNASLSVGTHDDVIVEPKRTCEILERIAIYGIGNGKEGNWHIQVRDKKKCQIDCFTFNLFAQVAVISGMYLLLVMNGSVNAVITFYLNANWVYF